MAVDKLVDSSQLDSGLTSIANAIRSKGGTTAKLSFPTGFVSAVNSISNGASGGTTTGSNVGVKKFTAGSGIHSLTLSGLDGKPKKFVFFCLASLNTQASRLVYCAYDGSDTYGLNSQSGTTAYKFSGVGSGTNGSDDVRWSYSGNDLIVASSGYIHNDSAGYLLIYEY